jgi:dolichol-phosphate mannosyltransferase
MIAAVGGLAGRPAADRRVAGRADGLVPAPELSVIVPTLNEADNIPLLYRALCDALAGTRWEMIVVDDGSTDGTVAVVNDIASHDSRVRCLRRLRRRGLAGAVTEGMLASSAFAVAVIDADLQHDEWCCH